MEDKYEWGAFIFGALSFLGIWIYAFATWGFLIGLGFGWIPALIGGYIIGGLWPLWVLLIGLAVGALVLYWCWVNFAVYASWAISGGYLLFIVWQLVTGRFDPENTNP